MLLVQHLRQPQPDLRKAVNQRQPPPKPRYDKSLERGIWRHCSQCDQPYAREKELLIMTRALQEQGLPTEHLRVCPDCRAANLQTNKVSGCLYKFKILSETRRE